jgi:hypothetical protein
MPGWAKIAIDQWSAAAGIHTGRVFRLLNKAGRLTHASLSATCIWFVVRKYRARAGLPHLAPHDLRYSYASWRARAVRRWNRSNYSLGHASIRTTERYLGLQQDLTDGPCDHLNLEWLPTPCRIEDLNMSNPRIGPVLRKLKQQLRYLPRLPARTAARSITCRGSRRCSPFYVSILLAEC